MTEDEVVVKLSNLFPQGFGDLAGLREWAGIYRDALRPFSGSVLKRVFDEMMAGWDKPYPPKPGALAVACQMARKDIFGGVDGRPNLKKLADQVRALKPVLVDDWLRGSGEEVEAFLGRFENDDPAPERFTAGDWRGVIARPSDRQRARRKLVELLEKRAHDVALAQASNGVYVAQPHVDDDPERRRRAQIDIVEADLDRIELEVHSQRYRSTSIGKALGYALPSAVLRDGPEPAREITPEDWGERTNPNEERESL